MDSLQNVVNEWLFSMVYLTQKPELGPSNETSTFFYEVSDDCNTIYVRDPYVSYDLKKVQQ